ncbi:hypothetical protein BG011_010221 [Mortierella polycephala]|uniref:F-box domain-containing protein n=1 Tax=Mortierella polycephala TaxID=41804 RepID=A0A9P6PMX8_9FUNG|nr:hypothetical protein BG011_010221 [Mortierella polycephala]
MSQQEQEQQEQQEHAALCLPEILTCIANHLTHMDFLNALLVSHAWHAHLMPLLWHTLILPQRWSVVMADSESPSGFPEPLSFRKYGHLVRSLICNNLQHHASYLVPACAQLTELDIIDLSDDALPLLRLNVRTLMSIKLKRERDQLNKPFRTHDFVQILDECLFLERIRLMDVTIEEHIDLRGTIGGSGSGPVLDMRKPRPVIASAASGTKDDTLRTIALFYQVLHRLSALDLVGSVIRTPPPRIDVFYRLRKLALINSSMSYSNQLQFVSQCQYLTHLKLQLVRKSERLDVEELATLELATACPRIIHLDLMWSTIKDGEIAALLGQLPHLTSFWAQRTDLAEKSIEVLAGPMSRIRDQLVELDLTDAREMKSCWIQRLLSSCSGLRRFRATEIRVQDMMNQRQMATSASADHPGPLSSWVCLKLQELQLSIIGISAERSLEDQACVYDQLSRLTDLQILSLGGNGMSTWLRTQTLELSLQSGFDQLRTLKELRVFNFSYMAHDLGMDEVEFMMEHWKKLRKVVGTIGLRVQEKRYSRGWGTNSESRRSGGGGVEGGMVPKVERHEIYIHRKWPLVHFSSR